MAASSTGSRWLRRFLLGRVGVPRLFHTLDGRSSAIRRHLFRHRTDKLPGTAMNTEPRRYSWLENIVAMAILLAAVSFFSHIHEFGEGIFSHMGKGAAGWIVYVLAMVIGAIVVIATLTQFTVRFRGPGPRPTWGEMIWSFLMVSIVGVFGYTFADNLQGEVRMKMTAGQWWNITLGDWPELQGAIGWMLAMFMFVGVWAAVSQIGRSWSSTKQIQNSK